MGNSPAFASNELYEVGKRHYINKIFTKKDWCSYDGYCSSGDLLNFRDEVCFLCRYRIPLDIPALLDEYNNKMKG